MITAGVHEADRLTGGGGRAANGSEVGVCVLGWGAHSAPGGPYESREAARQAGRELLVDFLLARNAELLDSASRLHYDDCAAVSGRPDASCDCGYPDRVAAECSARWRVTGLAQSLERWSALHPNASQDTSEEHLMVLYEVMAALATANADHPDYRPDLW